MASHGTPSPGHVAVSHEEGHVFLYADSSENAAWARATVETILAEQHIDGQLSSWRWHPEEDRWEDASLALPSTPAEQARPSTSAWSRRRPKNPSRPAIPSGKYVSHCPPTTTRANSPSGWRARESPCNATGAIWRLARRTRTKLVRSPSVCARRRRRAQLRGRGQRLVDVGRGPWTVTPVRLLRRACTVASRTSIRQSLVPAPRKQA